MREENENGEWGFAVIVVEMVYSLRTMELKCGGNGERVKYSGWGVLVKGRGVSEIYIMHIHELAVYFSICVITITSSSLDFKYRKIQSSMKHSATTHKTPTLPPISFSFLILSVILSETYTLNVKPFTTLPSNRSVNPL